MKKLKAICEAWLYEGKILKGFPPCSMDSLIFVYNSIIKTGEALSFKTEVAELCKKIGLNVKMDEYKVNYIISK